MLGLLAVMPLLASSLGPPPRADLVPVACAVYQGNKCAYDAASAGAGGNGGNGVVNIYVVPQGGDGGRGGDLRTGAPQGSSAAFQRPDWCPKASTVSERIVCADATLSRLDLAYNSAYQRARSQTANAVPLARAVVIARNGCGADRQCIMTTYRDAMEQLSALR